MSARLTALAIGLVVAAALGVWLHITIVPGLAWHDHRGDVSTGWGAIWAAWPAYVTTGGLTGLLALVVGLFVGDTARERDAEARATAAERERDAAREAADSAQADTQAAVGAERAELQRQQQHAREQIAAAKAARTAADTEAARGRERIADLERELGRCDARLAGALRAMQRGEAENADLRADLSVLRGESV